MSARPATARTPPNGWWGMAVFCAVEATLFGSLIASYFYLRTQAADWPPRGIAPPAVVAPLVLTALLVATSAPLAAAASAARAGAAHRTRRLIVLALIVQLGYLAVQIAMFSDDLGKVHPRDGAYGSVYVTLLGVHHAHVVLGCLLEAGLLARLAGGLTPYRVVGVRAVALYWHVVNAMAVLVVLTQLSAAL
jgi:heme/copper-type cytochrome/quinol oxidase subunit 3